MTDQMQRIVLASRPDGAPKDRNFRLETTGIPVPSDGEVLIKTHYFSLDPYMRGRMDDTKSYAASIPLGGLMEGGAVGEILVSNSPSFQTGDFVFSMTGWATHGVADAREIRKLNPSIAPITTALGVLGMPGFTGWYGLTELGKPARNETVVVAAATGPVGSMVGQMAKLRGLNVVGIAGNSEKCRLATVKYGFDACIDHRAFDSARDLREALAPHCPNGIDIYFENVGGKVLELILPMMNPFGRIPLCGMIAWYNAGGLGADAAAEGLTGPRIWRTILVKHLAVQGFIISNHFDRYPDFLKEVGPHVASGALGYGEDIAEGLETAPSAFQSMLIGGNKGKQIVKVI